MGFSAEDYRHVNEMAALLDTVASNSAMTRNNLRRYTGSTDFEPEAGLEADQAGVLRAVKVMLDEFREELLARPEDPYEAEQEYRARYHMTPRTRDGECDCLICRSRRKAEYINPRFAHEFTTGDEFPE